MAKIIRIEGENVFIGTDDGKVSNVSIESMNFSPVVGDEVDVFNNNGALVVVKKQNQMVNNEMNGSNFNNPNYNVQTNSAVSVNSKPDNITILLYIALALSVLACFLPLISISYLGVNYSINYVYNEGKMADGVIVIVIQIIVFILLFCKKKKAVCWVELFAVGIFSITAYNLLGRASELLSVSLFNYLGIGFYLLVISLIASTVLAFMIRNK